MLKMLIASNSLKTCLATRKMFQAGFSFLLVFCCCFSSVMASDWKETTCSGYYPHHLQGVCVSGNEIYWSFTTKLVKTDSSGQVLKVIDVANHHGDLCAASGKIYVAVNLGRFNRPAGEANSWIYVYDAETLKELSRHEVQDVVHGAGGLSSLKIVFLSSGDFLKTTNRIMSTNTIPSFSFSKNTSSPAVILVWEFRPWPVLLRDCGILAVMEKRC